MAIQLQGNGGTVAEVDGTGFRAQRVTPRPLDVGALGSYRASGASGVMAAGLAANSEVFQFRWTSVTALAVVTKISFDGLGSIVAFAAGASVFRVFPVRGWTSQGTGGASVALTGNNTKVRTAHGATQVNDIRVATTAALGVGTKSVEAAALAQHVGGLPATAGAGLPPEVFFDVAGGGVHPLVLTTNEGFVVQATVPATGTWQAGFTVEWSEVSAY